MFTLALGAFGGETAQPMAAKHLITFLPNNSTNGDRINPASVLVP